MPNYDTQYYDPPAPVAQVVLRDIQGGALQPNILMLLDTGADITLLPRRAVEQLGVKPIPGISYDLVCFNGTQCSSQAVELDMIFLGKAYRGRYVLIDAEQGVLGRDVLSNVALRFDGPRQEWSELDARAG